MPTPGRAKPKKPYPSFPLTPHPNGQWCKKIRGKVQFFGVWADSETALARYHTLASDLHAGRRPQQHSVSGGGPTVKDVCNGYLNWQKEKADAGEIHIRSFKECLDFVRSFAKGIGENRPVADLRPEDFQRYRMKLAKRFAPSTLTKRITVIRSVFKYAHDNDMLEKPVKFGKGFARPTAAQQRRAKSQRDLENGKRLFAREQILMIFEECPPWFRAPICLGINGGFGNTDCATLPISAIDLDQALIEYNRPKTGVQRVVPLWPETMAAIRNALKDNRPLPALPEAASLAFLGPRGLPLVRQVVRMGEGGVPEKVTHFDDLSDAFTLLLQRLRIHRRGLGFYSLRHTFRTWADEDKDQHAVHRIMGHAIPGMSGVYVEEIGLERLRAVVDHVRSKLWPSQ